MKLVFNPTVNSVVYGDGREVAPAEFAYVDEEVYEGVGKAIEDGRLIDKEIPAELPESLSAEAAAAVLEAVSDQEVPQTHDDPPVDPDANKGTDGNGEDSGSTPVGNTGNRRSNTTTKSKGA